MTTRKWIFLRAALAALAAAAPMMTVTAQNRRELPRTPRIYVFDNGAIKGLDDPKPLNFTRAELKVVDFVDVSYLIVHPRGTLMFDSGVISDSEFTGDGRPVVGARN